MVISVLLAEPQKPPTLGDTLSTIFVDHSTVRAQFGFAYATLSGLDSCIEPVEDLASFRRAKKRWLIGIHHGITEPAALTRLQELENSETRLFTPTGRLDTNSLLAQEKFHAKFVRAINKEHGIIIIGSANLTRSAISPDSTNYEACMAVEFDNAGSDISGYSEFDGWFKGIWERSMPVDSKVIDRYAQARAKLIDKRPYIASEFDEHSESRIDGMNHLWIEAGAMSGGARNQIEFGRKLSTFFGPIRKTRRFLRIMYNGQMRTDRPLTHKVTQWGTDIWRLGLPTSRHGGTSYPAGIVLLTKQRDKKGLYFRLDVASSNSPRARRWRAHANRSGNLARTSGPEGRLYGLF